MHHAVAAGDADSAASLLAYGADHQRHDAKGYPALAADRVGVELLHAIRQRHHRFHRGDTPPSVTVPAVAEWLAALQRRGIVKISGCIDSDELQRMRREFDIFVRHLGGKIAR